MTEKSAIARDSKSAVISAMEASRMSDAGFDTVRPNGFSVP
nr:hypothetical protein [Streptomyces sp. S063]